MIGGGERLDRRELIAPEALVDRPARAARATLRQDVVAEYAERIRDGARFPAVVVFTDGARYWLADGRHRLEAYREARPGQPVEVELHDGDELAALRFALTANAQHGARRSGDDLHQAYQVAARYQLVDPADAGAVETVLQCSTAAAYRLTKAARAKAREERECEINRLRDQGQSQAAIARDLGVDRGTVGRVLQNSQEKNASAAAGKREPKPPPKTPPPGPAPKPPASTGPAPAGAMETIERLARGVRVLAVMDPKRVAATLPARDRQRIGKAVEDLQRWSTEFLAAIGRSANQEQSDE